MVLAHLWTCSRLNSSLCRKTSRKCGWFFVEIVSLFLSYHSHFIHTSHLSLSLCVLLWRLFFQRLDMWWDLDLIDFHSLHVWSCRQLKSLWLKVVVFFLHQTQTWITRRLRVLPFCSAWFACFHLSCTNVKKISSRPCCMSVKGSGTHILILAFVQNVTLFL